MDFINIKIPYAGVSDFGANEIISGKWRQTQPVNHRNRPSTLVTTLIAVTKNNYLRVMKELMIVIYRDLRLYENKYVLDFFVETHNGSNDF